MSSSGASPCIFCAAQATRAPPRPLQITFVAASSAAPASSAASSAWAAGAATSASAREFSAGPLVACCLGVLPLGGALTPLAARFLLTAELADASEPAFGDSAWSSVEASLSAALLRSSVLRRVASTSHSQAPHSDHRPASCCNARSEASQALLRGPGCPAAAAWGRHLPPAESARLGHCMQRRAGTAAVGATLLGVEQNVRQWTRVARARSALLIQSKLF